MKIKWVTNSRVKALADFGIINEEDIIPRGSTSAYPAETATVAMRDVAMEKPWVSVHIRGKEHTQHYSTGYTGKWIAAITMRVNFGHDYQHKSLSGELCETLDFAEVDRVIKRVQNVMTLKEQPKTAMEEA